MHTAHECHEEVENVDAKLVLLQLLWQNQIVPTLNAENGNSDVSDEYPDYNH